MQRHSLILVGMGPRGLGVLERLNAVFHHENPAWGLDVHIVDPGELGQGRHGGNQPDPLLTDTVASQVTMFSDPTVQNAGPALSGPSLHEWARLAGYRNVAGRFVKTHSDGRAVDANDHLPRALLGAYLSFVFDQILAQLHPAIELHHYRTHARNLNVLADKRVLVELASGFSLLGDFAVLSTGNGRNRPTSEDAAWLSEVAKGAARNPYLGYISLAHPLSGLQSVSHDAVVAIQDIDLTTYDAIAGLTEGRGGRFDAIADRRLGYQRSGREPKILLFSRSGMPFSACAVNQKGTSGQILPKFFTHAWIEELRLASHRRGMKGQLDFERDLWPGLLKEMCLAYHTAQIGAIPILPAGYEPSQSDVADIQRLFHPLENHRFHDAAEYGSAVRTGLEEDLDEAFGGNLLSPVKAAADILRDVRDNLRHAVDFGGLTPESHQHFLRDFCPRMNRIAAGPPKERHMQLLALLDAGVVTLAPGPAPKVAFDRRAARFTLASTRLRQPAALQFDVLVRARRNSFEPEQDASPLFANALANKVARAYRNGSFHPGGIEVDPSQNVVDAQGRAHANLWALGSVAEGANFHTSELPRPMVNSRFIRDAGHCVTDLFRRAAAQDQRQEQPTTDRLSA